MSEFISAIAGALLGAMIGGVVSWKAGRRASRSTNTSNMHAEYFSLAMARVQEEAWSEVPATVSSTLEEYCKDPIKEKEIIHVVVVMRFYQRLSVMVERGEVDADIVPVLFGNDFMLWYYSLYQWWLSEDREKWSSGKEIQALYDRLKDNSWCYPTNWRVWTEEGEARSRRYRGRRFPGEPRHQDL